MTTTKQAETTRKACARHGWLWPDDSGLSRMMPSIARPNPTAQTSWAMVFTATKKAVKTNNAATRWRANPPGVED